MYIFIMQHHFSLVSFQTGFPRVLNVTVWVHWLFYQMMETRTLTVTFVFTRWRTEQRSSARRWGRDPVRLCHQQPTTWDPPLTSSHSLSSFTPPQTPLPFLWVTFLLSPPFPFFHLCSSMTQQGHGVNNFIFLFFFIFILALTSFK